LPKAVPGQRLPVANPDRVTQLRYPKNTTLKPALGKGQSGGEDKGDQY